MNDLFDLLSTISGNKYVQIVLFVCGAFTTLYQVFKDGPSFFKRQVKIPVWLIAVIILGIGWLFNHANSNSLKQIEPKNFKEIKGEVFGPQTVDIDGKSFLQCDFRGTVLRVTSVSGSYMVGCRLTDGTRFSYAGPAQTTLSLLTTLYKFPEMRPVIDTLFNDIRRGTIPEIPAMNNIAKR